MIFAMIGVPLLLAASMNFGNACQEGRQFAQGQVGSLFEIGMGINSNELLPEKDQGKSFDSEDARSRALAEDGCVTEATQVTEVTAFLLDSEVRRNERENACLSDDDWFLKCSDELSDHTAIEEEVLKHRIETCLVQDAPREIVVSNRLNVEVTPLPSESVEARSCMGHSGFQKCRDLSEAYAVAAEKRRAFAADPGIASSEVWIHTRGRGHRHQVAWVYTHHRNHPSCDFYRMIRVQVEQERWEEDDHWSLSQEKLNRLFNDPNVSFLGKVCVEGEETREVNGRPVHRPCWLEEYRFLSFDPNAKKSCPFFYQSTCDLIQTKCLEEGSFGCLLWEYRFRCWESTKVARTSAIINPAEEPYVEEPNTSFSEVTTKLSVFAEMKRQIEESNVSDVAHLALFSGKPYTCSKSIAEDLLYDCCFSMGGVARAMKLAHCTAEELGLADMRERGLCHYVGSHSEKFVGLWKSRDIHTFCCFPSKLARLLQEQGRVQLHLDWGESKSPNCRGLYHGEITGINFSELDLSELYEAPPTGLSSASQSKLDDLRRRIQRRVEEMGNDAF